MFYWELAFCFLFFLVGDFCYFFCVANSKLNDLYNFVRKDAVHVNFSAKLWESVGNLLGQAKKYSQIYVKLYHLYILQLYVDPLDRSVSQALRGRSN